MNEELVARIRNAAATTGAWLGIGSPVIAELVAEIGFDWLLLDLEHGNFTEADLLANLRAVRGSQTAAIVRVGSIDAPLIGRVLDWGAHGIMVPHVSSAEEAQACVRAMRYPPHGTRGYSRSVRAYGYGLNPPSDPSTSVTPLLWTQIETAEAVDNVAAIAAVDGVDILFIGPSDLKLDLVTCGSGRWAYEPAVRHVVAMAQQQEKKAGILTPGVDEAAQERARGLAHIGISSDLGILRAGLQEIFRVTQDAVS